LEMIYKFFIFKMIASGWAIAWLYLSTENWLTLQLKGVPSPVLAITYNYALSYMCNTSTKSIRKISANTHRVCDQRDIKCSQMSFMLLMQSPNSFEHILKVRWRESTTWAQIHLVKKLPLTLSAPHPLQPDPSIHWTLLRTAEYIWWSGVHCTLLKSQRAVAAAAGGVGGWVRVALSVWDVDIGGWMDAPRT
jgi:hypothetical protein